MKTHFVADSENGHVDTAGEGEGVMNWEIGIDIYTLICIKWITNKSLLYKKQNKKKCGLSKWNIISQHYFGSIY